jgi:hypothetical protein
VRLIFDDEPWTGNGGQVSSALIQARQEQRNLGLRLGEKLNEDLVDDEDEIVATRHDRIKIVRRPGRPMCSDIWLGELQACVEAGDVVGARRMRQTVVPAYRPSDVFLAATHAEDTTDQPDAAATDQFAEDATTLGESLC